jgi:hypothetical protein
VVVAFGDVLFKAAQAASIWVEAWNFKNSTKDVAKGDHHRSEF